jgi:uridine kinase
VTVPTSFDAVISLCRDLLDQESGVAVVAIDGHSGAGKSTLALAVAGSLDAAVITGDDFYAVMDDTTRLRLTPAEGAAQYFDWRRLRREALEPLRAGGDAAFHPFHWIVGTGFSPDATTVSARRLVLLEGVYSGRPELCDLVDAAVLVEVDERTRRERLVARGHDHGDWGTRWEAAERYYFEFIRRPESFDLAVTGT